MLINNIYNNKAKVNVPSIGLYFVVHIKVEIYIY